MSTLTSILSKLVEGQERAKESSKKPPPSGVQIKPVLVWPIFGDNDRDLDRFLEEFYNTVRMANNGSGVPDAEALILLRGCLKGSRKQAADVVVKLAQEEGLMINRHATVIDRIKEKLAEFKESELRRPSDSGDSRMGILDQGCKDGPPVFSRFRGGIG